MAHTDVQIKLIKFEATMAALVAARGQSKLVQRTLTTVHREIDELRALYLRLRVSDKAASAAIVESVERATSTMAHEVALAEAGMKNGSR